MSRIVIASVAGFVVLVSGCGKIIEAGTERVTEKVIESQTGGDVDINTDDGSFTITGEDGEKIELNTDEDGATLEITDAEGKTIEYNANEDDGSVVITGEDGELFTSGSELVDDWPSEFPIPGGLTIVQSGRFVEGDRVAYTATFEADKSFDSILEDFKSMAGGGQPASETTTNSDGQRVAIVGYELDSGILLTLFLTQDDAEETLIGTVSVTNYPG